MKHKAFFWFILPTLTAMILFIALPIVSVLIQSHACRARAGADRSGKLRPVWLTTQATTRSTRTPRRPCAPRPRLGRFNGLGTYTNRAHLAFGEIWPRPGTTTATLGEFWNRVMSLPFYRALSFTLTYTFVVTPFVLVLGLAIAVGVNRLPAHVQGPDDLHVAPADDGHAPVVGSLILLWMVDAEGIIGATIQNIVNDPSLSIRASGPLMWIMLMVYGIWSSIPFSFIVFLRRASDRACRHAGGRA